MGKTTSKSELISAAAAYYDEMNKLISSLTEKELLTPFEFSEKKKEAHWKRDKNLRDILIHLYEWHQLLLDWVLSNMNGDNKPFLPKPYNWRNFGKLNVWFWEKHQNTDLDEAKEMLAKSHTEVMSLVDTFSDEELFSVGVYKWVGNGTLGSFFDANTASHYNWAIKKLRAHRKIVKAGK